MSPLTATWSFPSSPSPKVTIRALAKRTRLAIAAMSSWSRDIRSTDSAMMHVARLDRGKQRIEPWPLAHPDPLIAASSKTPATVQPSRSARSRQIRTWSSIEAPLCSVVEYRA
jgi:hypothetical protein